MTQDGAVAVVQDPGAEYPANPPFHPPEIYPEYPFRDRAGDTSANDVYPMVRELFRLLQLDIQNYGSDTWNPLGEIVHPGDHVLIKPNFVFHRHMANGSVDSVITHGSVLRAIIDYAFIAAGRAGKITVADVPLVSADFDQIVAKAGLREIAGYYSQHQGFEISVRDLRPSYFRMEVGVKREEVHLPGDPLGYTTIDLGEQSELVDISENHRGYRIHTYGRSEPASHHSSSVNEYGIPSSVLDADVFINVPKLKTHSKAGVTLSLKNLIGISGKKEWLPHYRTGAPSQGGDEYPKGGLLYRIDSEAAAFLRNTHPLLWRLSYPLGMTFRKARKLLSKTTSRSAWDDSHNDPEDIRGGAWFGNDTLWRTILDLNKILFFADKRGCMSLERQRRYITIVDGITAGEGDGPFHPHPKQSGLLVGGINPIPVDMVCARLMGFDYSRIPVIQRASQVKFYPFGSFTPKDISIRSNNDTWVNLFDGNNNESLEFESPPGWVGHIELENRTRERASQRL